MTRATSHSATAAAALNRSPGNMGLLALGVGADGAPIPTVFHRGHVWFLEDHHLKAAPVQWLPESLGGMSTAASWYAPDWADPITAAAISGAARDTDRLQVAVCSDTPWSPQEIAPILAGLGIVEFEFDSQTPHCTRMVHATVCAQMDSAGRVLSWQVAEPGSEPTDSGQQVWNMATQEWEGLEQPGDWRALALLDDMLALAPVDAALSPGVDLRTVDADPLHWGAADQARSTEEGLSL